MSSAADGDLFLALDQIASWDHDFNRNRRSLKRYLALVRWGLAHRRLSVLSGVLLFAASIALAPLLLNTFIPASDRSMSTVNFELPPGTALAETSAVAEQACQVLARQPEVEHVLTTIGNGAPSSTRWAPAPAARCALAR
jgi:multidrug efflux pump subunit AcrB